MPQLGRAGIGPFFQAGREDEIWVVWLGWMAWHGGTSRLGRVVERFFRVAILGLAQAGVGLGVRGDRALPCIAKQVRNGGLTRRPHNPDDQVCM